MNKVLFHSIAASLMSHIVLFPSAVWLNSSCWLRDGCLMLQVGHRDFDVEKKLRRDLRRTHALLADAQLLLATMDSSSENLPNGSKDQIERLHFQVGSPLRTPLPPLRFASCFVSSPCLWLA